MNYMRDSLNYKNISKINFKYDTFFYCGNMFEKTAIYYYNHYSYLVSAKSPNVLVSNNLLNFLLHRYVNTWTYLNCSNEINVTIPIILEYDKNNIVIGNNLKILYENSSSIDDQYNNNSSTQNNSTTYDDDSQEQSLNTILFYLLYIILGVLFFLILTAIFVYYFYCTKNNKVISDNSLANPDDKKIEEKKSSDNINIDKTIEMYEGEQRNLSDDVPLQLISIDMYKLSIEEERLKNHNKLIDRLINQKSKINY